MTIAKERVLDLKEKENFLKHELLKSFTDQLSLLEGQVFEEEKRLVRTECEKHGIPCNESGVFFPLTELESLEDKPGFQSDLMSEIKKMDARVYEIKSLISAASPQELSVQNFEKLSDACCKFLRETNKYHLEDSKKIELIELFDIEEKSYREYYQTEIQRIQQDFVKIIGKLSVLSPNNSYFYRNAAKAAQDLLTTFNEKLVELECGELTIKQFFIDCTDAANKHRTVFESHRGWRMLQPILGLLAIAAISIAICFGAGPFASTVFLSAVSLSFTSQKVQDFFSPKTKTAEILDELLPTNSIYLK